MRYLMLALCLLLALPGGAPAEEEAGTAVLSADARDRSDYLHLIQKDDLLNIRVPEENPYFRDIGGVLFSRDGKDLLLARNERTRSAPSAIAAKSNGWCCPPVSGSWAAPSCSGL